GIALASGDWPQFQRDPAHTGFVTTGAQAPLVQAWHVDVPTGGPNGRYGLSSPVLSGGTVIAVGPTQVLGVDLATGQRRWSVSRDFGPSVPAATTRIAGKPIVVYTEGFGAHPPGSPARASGATGVRPTSAASPTSSTSASGSPAPGV